MLTDYLISVSEYLTSAQVVIYLYFSLVSLTLQRAEMRMVRWMCDIKVKDKVPSKELRERLGIKTLSCYYSKTDCDDMSMCYEKDNDWVKKCVEYEGSGGCQTKMYTKEHLESCAKRLSST